MKRPFSSFPILLLLSGFVSPLPGQQANKDSTSPPPAGPRLGEEVSRATVAQPKMLVPVPIFPDDPDSAVWQVRPRQAFALAQRQQRPLVLLFTTQWNPNCMALSEEVFSTRSFNDFARDELVLCFLDYPQSISEAPRSMREVKEKFHVAGYPSVLIFDPEGNVVREIKGYRKGKPVDYFGRLKAACLPVIKAAADRKEALRGIGFRDWKNDEGKELFARFVKRGEHLVTLQGADANTWTIDISVLDDESQEFVRSFPKIDEIGAEP